MRCQGLTVRLLLILVGFTAAAFAVSPKETVICAFPDQSDGYFPRGLVADAAGNLYGTAGGGATNEGIVYELSLPSQPGGSWTLTVLYTFQGGVDGEGPVGPLIFDHAGNLYGATVAGGHDNPNCSEAHSGCGTIFELSPPSPPGGSWTKSQLYGFQGGPTDGDVSTGIVFDRKGNFYGTTAYGGNGTCSLFPVGCGTVFQLTPPSDGSAPWTETILYNFQGGTDGSNPTSGVIPISLVTCMARRETFSSW